MLLDVSFLANLALFALIMLSGANVPVGELPAAMQAMSALLPMTRSIAAAPAFTAGASWDVAAPALLGDIAVGLAWATVGLLILLAIERVAVTRGALEGV